MTDEPEDQDPLTDGDWWQGTERPQFRQNEIRQHAEERYVRPLYTRAHHKTRRRYTSVRLFHQTQKQLQRVKSLVNS